MHPYNLAVLREYHRAYADEDDRERRRLHEAALDANEVTVERALQGRFSSALSRLRELQPHRSPRVSQPMEPTGA